jgi:hypothetical protein
MVGPISQAERDSFNRKLQVGVAALVAVSTGMVALGAGASPVQAAAALAVGVVVGGVIAWYAVPTAPAPAERHRSTPENPFADRGDDGDDSDSESERARSTTRRRRK